MGVGANITDNRQSDHRPLRGSNQPDLYPADTVGGIADYEIDLWGRVRNSVAAGRANAQASADDVASIRLSLQSQLASSYIGLRGLDQQAQLLIRAVAAYKEADRVTQNRFSGGIANGIDVGRSGAQLADAEAQLADVRSARALIEHALATLVGKPASSFTVTPVTAPLAMPAIPTGLPSTLLQRRPDVAAAERRMYAANREIGVARAAFFPVIGLGGTGGFQNTGLAGLVSAPNLFWSLGPTGVLNLFDGGRRRAHVALARAQWAQASSQYRETVLAAFQQVEDSLSKLHHLGDEVAAEDRAAANASQAERLSTNRYVKGATSELELVIAQAAELGASRRAIQISTQRLQANVDLLRALGGGWGT